MKNIVLIALFSFFGSSLLRAQCTEAPITTQSDVFRVTVNPSCFNDTTIALYVSTFSALSNEANAQGTQMILDFYYAHDVNFTNVLHTITYDTLEFTETITIPMFDADQKFVVKRYFKNNCGISDYQHGNFDLNYLFDLDTDSCTFHNYEIKGIDYFCNDFKDSVYTISGDNFKIDELGKIYLDWKLNGTSIHTNINDSQVTVSGLQYGNNTLEIWVESTCNCGEKDSRYTYKQIALKNIYVDSACATNLVSGKIIATEENTCNSSNVNAAYTVVEINDGFFRTISDSLGNYSIKLPDGEYKIIALNASYSSLICNPDSLFQIASDTVLDFISQKNEKLSTNIYLANARPGQNFRAYINVFNNGTSKIDNALIEIEYNGPIEDIATIPPFTAVNGNKISISGNNIDAQKSKFIEFYANVKTNAQLGDVIELKTETVTPFNVFNGQNLVFVRNSYDPNDKQVNHPKVDINDIDTRLQYQVRFQNTGNAPALKVVVTDTLDPLLDISTIEIGGSSHPFEVNFTENDVLVWTFNDINLPDNTSDLEGSQGYFTFSIKMKPNVSIGDEILNKANIFFDFNDPIITNAARTKILNLTSISESNSLHVTLFPNPSSDIVNLKSTYQIVHALVYNLQGIIVQDVRAEHIEMMDISKLSPGVYQVQLINTANQSAIKRMIKSN